VTSAIPPTDSDVSTSEVRLTEWLRQYPHLASCSHCHGFAREYLPLYRSDQVLIALLTYHESGHQHDPFLVAEEFVAIS
jgi:hypothetical protein